MFKLQRYILKEHIGPFFFTFFILMFIFVIKFLLQYSGRLFGKGLPLSVILEFLFVNLAWMIALTVPMSVLVATLMAFGRMSADNEVIALKSAGITVYRMIISPLIAASLIALAMVWFNDKILPELNHRSRVMLSEVSRKKPTLSIEPGVFVKLDNGKTQFIVKNMVRERVDSLTEAENLVGPKYPKFRNKLEEITIFTTTGNSPVRTITADYGYMIFDERNARIILKLFSGEIHERISREKEEYRRTFFLKNTIYIPAREFVLRQDTKSDYRGDREMGIEMMEDRIAGFEEQKQKFIRDLHNVPNRLLKLPKYTARGHIKKNLNWKMAVDRAKSKIQSAISSVFYLKKEIGMKIKRQHQLEVEIQKKYSIPVASIIFILIGAPLGIMARKGGLAIGFSMSIVFFLIYWISLILGERLADKMIISPFVAMWGANVIVGILGVYLLSSAVRESKFIDWDRLKALFNFKDKESGEPDEEN
jgi:lipopolysaccharide export system permease protein